MRGARIWKGTGIAVGSLLVAVVIGVAVKVLLFPSHTGTVDGVGGGVGGGNFGSSLTTLPPPGTYQFTSQSETGTAIDMSVAYEGSAEATAGVSGSEGRQANYVQLTFRYTNTGNTVVPGFIPYQVYVQIGSQAINYAGQDWAFTTGLLPGYHVDITGGPVQVPIGDEVTQIILVPTLSSTAPYPTWPVSIGSTATWCALTSAQACSY